MTATENATGMLVIAAALVAVAAVVGLSGTSPGDGDYCGRLFYDTIDGASCGMTMRRWSFAALVTAAAVITVAVFVATRRFRLLVTVTLATATVVAALVGLNRLLEPTPPTVGTCGSLLRRIGSSGEEPCDAVLASHRRVAIGAFTAAITLAVSTVVFARKKPRAQPRSPGHNRLR